jgi:elongation factor Ts
MASVGERIEFKRVKILKSENGFVSTYIHFGSKVGSIIAFTGKYSPEADDLGKKVAMQTVAMTPITVRREEVTQETIDKEKEIYMTQAKNEKKPDNIIGKIVDNKLEKFFQENCLVEQSFIQDEKKSIGDILKDYSKVSGEPLDVLAMARFQLG